MRLKIFASFVFLALSLAFLPEGRGKSPLVRLVSEEEDPPEVAAGERLFRETRFAQFFFDHAASSNQPLEKGDPSLYQMKMANGAALQNPYIGKSMNCAACHLVDEALDQAGMRSYADFSFKSFVPFRAEDRESETARNSPSLVGVVRPGKFLHFDGEFIRAEDLVIAGWTGRNNGWLPKESGMALSHIARILREDDGSFSEDGVSYSDLFAGKTSLPEEFRLSPNASDQELVFGAARLVRAYMESLEFTRTSPFDLFLQKNGLPGSPAEGESPEAFHRRLLSLLEENREWEFVEEKPFQFHAHPNRFGREQLAGLKIFLDAKRGNCASCHQLPHFTDFSFHNTGISQLEFDGVHGPAAFLALRVPALVERSKADLPADAGNLEGTGVYRAKAVAEDPRRTDLGLWNIFANAAHPVPQAALRELLCPQAGGDCSPDRLLDLSLGRFKTPSLRDLGHSAPYFHNGSGANLEEAVRVYIRTHVLARKGALRNGAPELSEMRLVGADMAPLAAFLKSLDEDYE